MKLKTKFQDEDFELGEVVDRVIVESLGKYEKELRVLAVAADNSHHIFYYRTDNDNALRQEFIEDCKEIGSYFETKEEAEKAVEKLKAWKRLKDKGFRFDGYDVAEPVGDGEFCGQVFFRGGNYSRDVIKADLDLLFGGKE